MKKEEYKAPAYASLALAFASLGDAFLYAFLPVNAIAVGVPILWVGVLLSINRFVRIFSNAWMIHLFAAHGLRVVTIVAVVFAIVSTAGYSVATTVFAWLVCRIVWGLSFSAMRISTLGYALQHPQQGFTLGLTRGIQETGPMLALLLLPLLLAYFNPTTTFLALTCLSLPALYFAWKLPFDECKVNAIPVNTFLKIPSILNTITFVSAFLIDGIIVVVLGILFLSFKENITLLMATSLAAIYLGYRRVCLVIFSPAGGLLADSVGLGRVYTFSLMAMIIGLIIIMVGGIEFGAIILFTFYSVHAAITPGKVARRHDHQLSAVAENATWRDIGAAAGTLAGGLLLNSQHLGKVLTIVTLSLSLMLIVHLKKSTGFKPIYLWK